MNQATPFQMPPPGRVQRATIALCPPAQRQWIRAMFAELTAIDQPAGRTSWAIGAAAIVVTAIETRIISLSLRMRIGIVLAFVLAASTAAISYIDVQAVLLDDELLAAFSVIAGVAAVCLAAAAVRRVFIDTEAST
jgi:hypothetical protein